MTLNNAMRSLVFVLMAVALVFVGCNTDRSGNLIEAPDTFGSEDPGGVTITQGDEPILTNVRLMPLPNGRGKSANVSVTKLVSPNDGGILTLTNNYISSSGQNVVRKVRLTVPPRALQRAVQITMELDTTYMGVKFYPCGLQFRLPVTVDFDGSGDASLFAVDGFYYDMGQGLYEFIPALGIRFNVNERQWQMRGAVLTHFSRYAFGREAEE